MSKPRNRLQPLRLAIQLLTSCFRWQRWLYWPNFRSSQHVQRLGRPQPNAAATGAARQKLQRSDRPGQLYSAVFAVRRASLWLASQPKPQGLGQWQLPVWPRLPMLLATSWPPAAPSRSRCYRRQQQHQVLRPMPAGLTQRGWNWWGQSLLNSWMSLCMSNPESNLDANISSDRLEIAKHLP